MKTLVRWWCLLFRKKFCVKIIMDSCPYVYGDMICASDGAEFKCLGKNWYYRKEVYNLKIN